MLREDCKYGMTVEFGRENGAITKAKIIKLNDKKAKVQTIEQRNSHPAGTVWNVPYHMLQPTVSIKLTKKQLDARESTIECLIEAARRTFSDGNYTKSIRELKEAVTLVTALEAIRG